MVKDISEKERAEAGPALSAILLLNNLKEYNLRQGYSEAMIK